ncbi:MAG: recombination-associated protein RdgC [Ectothiorhodospiraceae bacterium]
MWFKNLCLYTLEQPFAFDAEGLDERLAREVFQPCGRLDQESGGWAPPLGDDHGQLVHATGPCLMLALKEESKLLPAGVVRESLDERVQAIQAQEGRKVRKKEKDRLRDEIVMDLLPRAFSRSRRTFGYVDTQNQWLLVDAATWKKAEAFTERLRDVLGTLPVQPPDTDTAPQRIMTRWLTHDGPPSDFTIGDECILVDPELEGGEVRCKRLDLSSSEVRNHLKAGKRVARLALTWQDRVSFVLDADMSLKRIRFLDAVQDERAETESHSDAERFDSDFAIMSLELGRLIPRLLTVMDAGEGA